MPVPNGAGLVTVSGQKSHEADNRFGVSYPDFLEFRASQRSFDGLEASSGFRAIVSENTNPPNLFMYECNVNTLHSRFRPRSDLRTQKSRV